ncbi:MAG: lysozyme inhibitor LprI family protein [Pseudomonadota bacterium]
MAVDVRARVPSSLTAVFLSLTLAVPAAAEDATALEACLAAQSWDTRKTCIGTISGPCQEQPSGATTIGIVDCLNREHRAWDTLLNRWWPDMKADAEATDASNREYGIDAPDASETLLNAQRAWLSYRDAECTFQWLRYAGGTIRGPVAASCMMEMTAERAIGFYGRTKPLSRQWCFWFVLSADPAVLEFSGPV